MSAGSPSADLRRRAAEAIRLVQMKPEDARAVAGEALTEARRVRDGGAESMAERALGLAAKERNDLDGAAAHLRAAVRVAARAGEEVCAAEARMSLSLVLAHCGRMADALREADRAAEVLKGPQLARLQMQRSLVLQQLGRFDEALAGYRRALPVLRRAGDRLWEARVLGNRGVLHTYRRAFAAAEADLRRAEGLFEDLGLDLGVGLVRHNLGYLFAVKGDVPAALEWYERAEERYSDAGVTRAELLLDRGELYLSVRLVADARRTAEQAIGELAGQRMAMRLAEARLMLSQAALLQGDLATAKAAAAMARRTFARHGRRGWDALAQHAALRAAWADEGRSPATLRAALRTADALARTGWTVPALDARILAARVALALGRVDLASGELSRAGRARNRGPVELRSRAWHAKALLHVARGQRRQALAALRCGMDVLDEHRAALGATELRAHLSAHGAELADAGLRLALEAGDPAGVLEWAERWRAGALRSAPVRPPADPVLAADLAELRRVVGERDKAALAGGDTAVLLQRQARLEDAVRRRSQRASGEGAPGGAPALSVEAMGQALGGKALVEMVEVDARLHAVVLTGDGMTLCELGPAREVAGELEAMQFALRRLARNYGSEQSLGVAARAVGFAAERLDRLLLEPIADRLEDRPLVLSPTGPLHATPWSLLPSCLGRAVTVTPSATLWQPAAPGPAAGGDDVVLVAGPDLPHGAREVARLARTYRGATRLAGHRANVDAVLGALDGAALAHVAAHGRFRADNPLFSCLLMADGPLTVYDLERLRRAPRTLILSACESGLSRVQAGDELMGLAAALLGLGTRTLVASVVAVPDEQTTGLMLDVHRRLRAGDTPAEALCRAQARTIGSGDPGAIAAAAGFICFGRA